jgi:predicted RNA-binding protein
MESIWMAQYDSNYHLYQGFHTTPEGAMKVCLKGYKENCKRNGWKCTSEEIKEVKEAIWTLDLRMGKCMVDGREWL